jgi:hypothetical protein
MFNKITTIEQAKEVLELYFTYNRELRTIASEEGVITRRDLLYMDNEDVFLAAHDAQDDMKASL